MFAKRPVLAQSAQSSKIIYTSENITFPEQCAVAINSANAVDLSIQFYRHKNLTASTSRNSSRIYRVEKLPPIVSEL